MIDGATADQIKNLVLENMSREAELSLVQDDVKLVYQHYYEMKVEVELLQDEVEALKPPSAMFWVVMMVMAFGMGMLACYGAVDFIGGIREHTPR